MPQLPNRKSNRLSNYDYSNAGAYFITICSKNRKNIFSKIITDHDGTGPRIAARAVPMALLKIIGSFKSKCSVEYLQYINENKLYTSGQI